MDAAMFRALAAPLLTLLAFSCGTERPPSAQPPDSGDARGAAPDGTGGCVVGGSSATVPIIVACDQRSPARIVSQGDNVFWTGEVPGVVVSQASRAGGRPQAIASSETGAFGLAVTATTIYWTEPNAGLLKSAPRGGGRVTIVATGLNAPMGLATDGDNLYWSEARNDDAPPPAGAIMKLALRAGSQPIRLVAGLSRPHAIVTDGVFVYWTDLTDGTVNGALAATPADGGARDDLRTLAGGFTSPTDLALSRGHLYWPDQRGFVWGMDVEGQDAQLLASAPGRPFSVAVDAQHVYWSAVDDGTVRRAPLRGGGDATTLAAMQDQPQFVAVDETTVYWTSRGAGGRVAKTAK